MFFYFLYAFNVFAQMHGADFKELLSSSSYKEVHRLKMVTWSEQVKMEKNDPVYFLKEAIEMWKKEEKKIWIISDARRVCDVEYFKSEQFKDVKVIAIRITASEETRKNRKWTFTENIDDAQTECGLDNYKEWDYIINNDGSLDDLKKSMQPIFEEFKKLEN